MTVPDQDPHLPQDHRAGQRAAGQRAAGQRAAGQPLAGDPGLQRERTALAWQRTSISGVLIGAGALVAAAHTGSRRLVVLVSVLVVVLGVAAVAVSVVDPGAAPTGALPSPWRRLVTAAAVPGVLAVVGLVLSLR